MKFGEILKTAESEGKEKHVPVIEVDEAGSVRVIVGKEVPHPNTVEHHIVWVELFGVKTDGQVITLGRADFSPTYSDPDSSFQVKLEGFKSFCALSYCNIHGVWENCLDV